MKFLAFLRPRRRLIGKRASSTSTTLALILCSVFGGERDKECVSAAAYDRLHAAMNTSALSCADCSSPSTYGIYYLPPSAELAQLGRVCISTVSSSPYLHNEWQASLSNPRAPVEIVYRNIFGDDVMITMVYCLWLLGGVSSFADPQWASINRGVLICNECCSVHRSLGRHVSQIRSIRAPNWPPVQKEVRWQRRESEREGEGGREEGGSIPLIQN